MQGKWDARETIELLWGRICLQQGLLVPLLRALCHPPLPASEALSAERLGSLHSLTLHALAEEAQSPTAASHAIRYEHVAILPTSSQWLVSCILDGPVYLVER